MNANDYKDEDENLKFYETKQKPFTMRYYDRISKRLDRYAGLEKVPCDELCELSNRLELLRDTLKQVVVANYTVTEIFQIPQELDLNNNDEIESWWVKWNILHIIKVDGTEIEIEGDNYMEHFDYKRPDECSIDDATNW